MQLTLGYVGNPKTIVASTDRTCRLASATPERLRTLIGENLANLRRVLTFNTAHTIRLYRISSGVVPFASHPVNTLPWWEEFGPELSQLGAFIRANGLRVSFHPGQFTVLNSPRPEVRQAAGAELAWHGRFLETMGLGREHKIVIHLGGVFGDHAAALRRFIAAVQDLSEPVRRRLVCEHDERLFGPEDALAAGAATTMPVVFDWLHYQVFPQSARPLPDVLRDCLRTWGPDDGPPKVHFSSQAPGKAPGAHSAWANPDDFQALLRTLAASGWPGRVDSMLECKEKDGALFRLRADLAGRGLVA